MTLGEVSADPGIVELWSRIEVAILSTLFAVVLALLYRDSVAPSFGYMGFEFYGLSVLGLAAQSVLIVLLSFALPLRFTNVGHLLLWLVFLFVVVPCIVIVPLVINDYHSLDLLLFNSFLCIAFYVLCVACRVNVANTVPALSKRFFWFVIFAVVASFCGLIVLDYGLSYSRLFDLSNYAEIYDLRYEFREQSTSVSVVTLYGLFWMAKVLVPVLWAGAILSRRIVLIFAVFMLQLGLFAVSGHKSFLFSLLFVAFVLWLLARKRAGVWFVRLMTCLVLGAAGLFYFFDFELLVSVVVRRVFIVPGMLTGYFFEYYLVNPLALYANNFLEPIIRSSYDAAPAFTIGYEYFNRQETSANVNFFGDALANLGLAGMLLVATILAAIVVLINAATYEKNRPLSYALFAVPFWTLTETSLATTIVTHGLFLGVILALLLHRED